MLLWLMNLGFAGGGAVAAAYRHMITVRNLTVLTEVRG